MAGGALWQSQIDRFNSARGVLDEIAPPWRSDAMIGLGLLLGALVISWGDFLQELAAVVAIAVVWATWFAYRVRSSHRYGHQNSRSGT